ncbi:PCYCGC domain-containing protein [Paraburkholderia tagetis]|uniref:PCYCGC domain-containing protein n=1 Tax=Paraburkholderia tagetis TaxID=2913261 RepID=A0A9X2A2I5_9BURK|nr:PCYCGC domain-containing protein [Paraburkholderia tagetis]MCG5078531.1 PCYCGC domain-containing protein [Paraburkholderia tagetis]
MWHLMFLLAMVIAIPAVVVLGPSLVHRLTESTASAIEPSNPVQQVPGWRVGMLRPDGLRIIPGGRSDASHVLNPNQFADKEVRHTYWVATQIPVVLNKLYCCCGCENRGVHRSNLQCFEDQMAVTCAVCQGTAEIAYQMTQAGIQDAGKIQAAVDAKLAPKG